MSVISSSFALGARFSEEHHGANEFFRLIVGFAMVMFMPGQFHRLHEPFSQVIDETRLGTGHVGDQGLQDPFMGQHAPFEIGRLRSRTCKSFRLCHGLLRPPKKRGRFALSRSEFEFRETGLRDVAVRGIGSRHGRPARRHERVAPLVG